MPVFGLGKVFGPGIQSKLRDKLYYKGHYKKGNNTEPNTSPKVIDGLFSFSPGDA